MSSTPVPPPQPFSHQPWVVLDTEGAEGYSAFPEPVHRWDGPRRGSLLPLCHGTGVPMELPGCLGSAVLTWKQSGLSHPASSQDAEVGQDG